MRAATAKTHQAQYIAEWGIDNPEYFDHFLDQYYQWGKTRAAGRIQVDIATISASFSWGII